MRVVFGFVGILGMFLLFAGVGLIDESASVQGMMIGFCCSLIGLAMVASFVVYDHSNHE